MGHPALIEYLERSNIQREILPDHYALALKEIYHSLTNELANLGRETPLTLKALDIFGKNLPLSAYRFSTLAQALSSVPVDTSIQHFKSSISMFSTEPGGSDAVWQTHSGRGSETFLVVQPPFHLLYTPESNTLNRATTILHFEIKDTEETIHSESIFATLKHGQIENAGYTRRKQRHGEDKIYVTAFEGRDFSFMQTEPQTPPYQSPLSPKES